MKRLILSAAYTLSLINCGDPPTGPNQKLGNESSRTEVKLPAPKIKVFVENSDSMDGYVKGATGFESTVYSHLSDVQHADLRTRIGSLATKNMLVLNYVNNKVLQQRPDIREFIETLEPADFKMKGGKRGASDIPNTLDTIMSQADDDEVSIFVSGCIFSLGKKYKAKDSADEYIVAQQIDIRDHVIEKLVRNLNSSTVVMRLTSQFNGICYNKFDDRQPINSDRPFSMWLIDDKSFLNTILEEVELNQIKDKGV